MRSPVAVLGVEAPYPGLRPFRSEEAVIFFGRDAQVDELLEKLADNRFIAVLGSSGCGKSSLVRAGLIPALKSGLLTGVGLRWRVVTMRPGNRPTWNLACGLLDAAGHGPEARSRPEAGFLHASLRSGSLGLVEALRSPWWARVDGLSPSPHPDGGTDPYQGENVLLVVDQFEEVIRFRDQGGRDESEAFVALLLASAAYEALPVHVVLTMRSDSLGDCVRFAGLPERLNRGQFLTPALDREQRRQAIEGPARVFGGEVEPDLVQRLLNDQGEEPDQLPLLQHALLRVWDAASDEGGDGPRLGLAHYEQVGGLREALSRHADETFNALDLRRRDIARTLLLNLVQAVGDDPPFTLVRRHVALGTVCELARATEGEVKAVVEEFRADHRSFLAPPPPAMLTKETILDVTHESLIRQWDQLREWAEAEANVARVARLRAVEKGRQLEGRTPSRSQPGPTSDLAVYIVHDPADAPKAETLRRLLLEEFKTVAEDVRPGVELWSGLGQFPRPDAIGPLAPILLVLPSHARDFNDDERREIAEYRRRGSGVGGLRLIPVSLEPARDHPSFPLADVVTFRLHDLGDADNLRKLRTLALNRLALRASSRQRSIYLSCKPSDGLAWARVIATELRTRGYNIWLSEEAPLDTLEDDPSRAETRATIGETIRRQGLVLVIDTSEARASFWVDAEIDSALGDLVPILPIVIEDVIPTASPGSMPVPGLGGRFPQLRAMRREIRIPNHLSQFHSDKQNLIKDARFFDHLEDAMSDLLLAHLRSRRRLIFAAKRRFESLRFVWSPVSASRLLFRAEVDRGDPSSPGLALRFLVLCCPYETSLEAAVVRIRVAYDQSPEPYQYCLVIHQKLLDQTEKQAIAEVGGGIVTLAQPDEIDRNFLDRFLSMARPAVAEAGSDGSLLVIEEGVRFVIWEAGKSVAELQWVLPRVPDDAETTARSWVRLLVVLAKVYPVYLATRIQAVRAEAASGESDALKHRARCLESLQQSTGYFLEFRDALGSLDEPFRQTPMVQQLIGLVKGLDAVRVSLASPDSNATAAYLLIEKTGEWLLDALHIATRALESSLVPLEGEP